jgi:D-alanyl-D-alanine carboxypeptidase
LIGGTALALCFAAVPAAAENTALERELDDVIEAFLAENEIAPGVCVYAVCPPLSLDWEGAAGTVAKGDSTPLTAAHTFRIASNTKTYVAAAVMRLVETGRLGLDDPLSAHLTAEWNALLESDGYETDSITIAQVLSHTAGLGDHSDDPRFEERIIADPRHQWTPAEKLRLLVDWRDPVGRPGERYAYSDTGYIILGSIIERITGSGLGPAVRDLLDFERLGLRVTYWEYVEEPPARAGPRAHQYFGEEDVTGWNASFDLYGGGGIVTDARELALFTRKLLTGEVLAKKATLAAMLGRGTYRYRLGIMVMECDGYIVFGHQGFWNTFAYHVPALDLTVGGGILNHHATNGFELLCRLVNVVAAAKR